MTTAWLAELYRRWGIARSKRVTAPSRVFSVNWVDLLESAGITSVEDQATAAREAEICPQVVLKRHRYRRYLIERVALPLVSEPWLVDKFGGTTAEVLQASALQIISNFSAGGHSRYPAEWAMFCESLRLAYQEGRSLRPFYWSRPATLPHLLDVVKKLSEREWPAGTFIRAASVEIGLESKELERHQRTFESGLARLFGTETLFKSLGIAGSDSHIELHGPVCLHFPDGSFHHFDGLTEVLISSADLARCSSISTTAKQLLSIENRKTTFRHYAAANENRRILIAATSYPTTAFRQFLEKLPLDLPHHHFGDTDPAGWHILLKLREATPRPVSAFQMKWQKAKKPSALTPFDRKLLPKLLADPLLKDVWQEIQIIQESMDRGNYEQETLGPPTGLEGWP